jgi:hypothetical protein
MGSVKISDVSMPAWAILGRLLPVTAGRCNIISSIARPVSVRRWTIYSYGSELKARGRSTFESAAVAPERPANDRYSCPAPGLAREQWS